MILVRRRFGLQEADDFVIGPFNTGIKRSIGSLKARPLVAIEPDTGLPAIFI